MSHERNQQLVPFLPNWIPTLADPKARFYRNPPVSATQTLAPHANAHPNSLPSGVCTAQGSRPECLTVSELFPACHSIVYFPSTHFPNSSQKWWGRKRDEETRNF